MSDSPAVTHALHTPDAAPAQAPRAAHPVRNFGIDGLRGLAILLVIVHHLALPFRLPLKHSLLADWVPARLREAIGFNGYEAVFMFFTVSGFLIATRIAERHGDLARVDLRWFYRKRAVRIVPLLGLVLAVLTLLAALGVPDFAPYPGEQSIAGLLGSALTFTFNWYEGRTGWAPAGWDVLWSLSIEEAFYVGFPLMCLWLPRRVLVAVLVAWALAIQPLRALVPASDEVWWEKAYLPGMAAIAWGVLAALLARRWRAGPYAACALGIAGGAGLALALVWSDLLYRWLPGSFLYCLCGATAALLLACHARPPAPRTGLRWLARMGSLSYELYLSHMFVVLAAVALYRALLGATQAWTFVVYVPVVVCACALALLLERLVARIDPKMLAYRPRRADGG